MTRIHNSTVQDLGLALLAGLHPLTSFAQQCYRGLPDPILKVRGYQFTIENRADFPEELFERAPNLALCGRNTNSSRTWIDLINQDVRRFYGYCAVSSPTVLKNEQTRPKALRAFRKAVPSGPRFGGQ